MIIKNPTYKARRYFGGPLTNRMLTLACLNRIQAKIQLMLPPSHGKDHCAPTYMLMVNGRLCRCGLDYRCRYGK